MDTTQIYVLVGVVIVILYWVFQKPFNKILRKLIMRISPSESFFHVALSGFLFFAALIASLYISNGTGQVNMTTLWLVLVGFLFIAFVAAIRIKMEPKDTRLDEINGKLDKIIENMLDKTTANELIATMKELILELKRRL